jgi:GNAT superfamily N-acetyltransferase
MDPEGFEIDVLNIGEVATHELKVRVMELFSAAYYSYHYGIDEAMASSRIRLVLKDRERVVGFCTIAAINRFGYLSNLVVHPQCRGRGFGTLLENRRANIYRAMGLTPYVSCVTVGLQSQRSKVSLGLKRLNIKFGYRIGVFSEHDVSSATTYAGNIQGVPELRGPEGVVVQNQRQKRVRNFCHTPKSLERALCDAREMPDFYIDVLCDSGLCQFALEQPLLQFIGKDLDLEREQVGFLFQVTNARYLKARQQGLDLVEPEENLRSSMLGEFCEPLASVGTGLA